MIYPHASSSLQYVPPTSYIIFPAVCYSQKIMILNKRSTLCFPVFRIALVTITLPTFMTIIILMLELGLESCHQE